MSAYTSSDPLSRLEDKLDKQNERLSSIDVTLASQHGTLQEHMRRTANNEVALERHFDQDKESLAELAARLKPLEEMRTQFTANKALLLAAIPVAIELAHLFLKH